MCQGVFNKPCVFFHYYRMRMALQYSDDRVLSILVCSSVLCWCFVVDIVGWHAECRHVCCGSHLKQMRLDGVSGFWMHIKHIYHIISHFKGCESILPVKKRCAVLQQREKESVWQPAQLVSRERCVVQWLIAHSLCVIQNGNLLDVRSTLTT